MVVRCVKKKIYIGEFNDSNEYCSDDNGRERIGTIFVERDLVDNRYVVMDRRLHWPQFVWRKVCDNKQIEEK